MYSIKYSEKVQEKYQNHAHPFYHPYPAQNLYQRQTPLNFDCKSKKLQKIRLFYFHANNRKTSHHETTLIETRMTSHRCQSKAGVSIKALILLSSSALLGGGASWTGLLDWTGKTSGIAYKSFPNSSHSESSGYKANQFNKLLHLHTKNWYTQQNKKSRFLITRCKAKQSNAYIFWNR